MLFSCIQCKELFPVSQAKFRMKVGAGQKASPCCRVCAKNGDAARRELDALHSVFDLLNSFIHRVREKKKIGRKLFDKLNTLFGDSFERLFIDEQVALVRKRGIIIRRQIEELQKVALLKYIPHDRDDDGLRCDHSREDARRMAQHRLHKKFTLKKTSDPATRARKKREMEKEDAFVKVIEKKEERRRNKTPLELALRGGYLQRQEESKEEAE